MNIAICFIGTNIYRFFFEKYYNSIFDNLFIHSNKHIFVFSDFNGDGLFNKKNTTYINIQNLGWPYDSIYRYKYIKGIKDHIIGYDYFLYIDPDMIISNKISEEVFFIEGKPFIGVQHPSFNNKDFDYRIGTFENRIESTAFVDMDLDDTSNYFQGCLWGGKIPKVLNMIDLLDKNVKTDEDRNIMAIWYDESHLNRFFIDNKSKVNILNSSYCYPEKWKISFDKNIIHLDKSHLNIVK